MAKVAILIRISAEEQEKLDSIIKDVKENFKPINIGLEDLAFGIKVIKALFHIEEDKGSSYLEDELSKVDGVTGVEVLSVDRLG